MWVNREAYPGKPLFNPQTEGCLKDTEVTLYEHKQKATTGDDTAELLTQMGPWSYGLPFAEALPNGEVMIGYYAGTNACMECRWARLTGV